MRSAHSARQYTLLNIWSSFFHKLGITNTGTGHKKRRDLGRRSAYCGGFTRCSALMSTSCVPFGNVEHRKDLQVNRKLEMEENARVNIRFRSTFWLILQF